MNSSSSLKDLTRNSVNTNKVKVESKNASVPPQSTVGYKEYLGNKLPHFLGSIEDRDGCESERERERESELMMLFDSAHSCSLAEEHINSRR